MKFRRVMPLDLLHGAYVSFAYGDARLINAGMWGSILDLAGMGAFVFWGAPMGVISEFGLIESATSNVSIAKL